MFSWKDRVQRPSGLIIKRGRKFKLFIWRLIRLKMIGESQYL